MSDDRHQDHADDHQATAAPQSRAQPRAVASRASRPGVRLNGYLLSWMALSAAAFGYIAVAATRPDLLPGVIPLAEQAGEQLAGGRNNGDVADEIASLRKWVNDLQHEMVAAKSALKQSEQQQQTLLQRMTAAEERLAPVREIRADAPTSLKSRQAEAKAAKAAAVTTAAVEPADSRPMQAATAAPHGPEAKPVDFGVVGSNGLKVINAGAASDIITSSVNPPAGSASTTAVAAAPVATPFTSAKVTPASQVAAPAAQQAAVSRGIVIADADSLDGLRTRWTEISGRNAALKRLEPRYRISDASNSQTPFTLLAGPFTSTEDAARTCAQLRASGVSCRVSEFTGNGL